MALHGHNVLNADTQSKECGRSGMMCRVIGDWSRYGDGGDDKPMGLCRRGNRGDISHNRTSGQAPASGPVSE